MSVSVVVIVVEAVVEVDARLACVVKWVGGMAFRLPSICGRLIQSVRSVCTWVPR